MKDEMTRAPFESYGVLREIVGGIHTINFLVRKSQGLHGPLYSAGAGF